jgi:hypothetical protein
MKEGIGLEKCRGSPYISVMHSSGHIALHTFDGFDAGKELNLRAPAYDVDHLTEAIVWVSLVCK